MGKLWQVCLVGVLGIAFLFLSYVVLGFLTLGILDAKYDGLSGGLTVGETDRIMGVLFRAEMIDWDDIGKVYTDGYDKSKASIIREYEFFGVNGLSIVVLYEKDGRSYLHIPIYE